MIVILKIQVDIQSLSRIDKFWINLTVANYFAGHGGSDGLHGYVPSLDYVVEDTVSASYCYFPDACIYEST